jgi:prevent-host-death family protein
MKTVTAKDAEADFGQVLDTAARQPVAITHNGRQVAVVLSAEDFERLAAFEDSTWARYAEHGEEGGYLSAEESEVYLKSLDAGR